MGLRCFLGHDLKILNSKSIRSYLDHNDESTYIKTFTIFAMQCTKCGKLISKEIDGDHTGYVINGGEDEDDDDNPPKTPKMSPDEFYELLNREK